MWYTIHFCILNLYHEGQVLIFKIKSHVAVHFKVLNLPAIISCLFPGLPKHYASKISFVETFKMIRIAVDPDFYFWTKDQRERWKSKLERNGFELSNPRFTTQPFLFFRIIISCAVVSLLLRLGKFILFHPLRRFIIPQTIISDISCYSPCINMNKLCSFVDNQSR